MNMLYNGMTSTVKRRFVNSDRMCPICGEQITRYQDISYFIQRNGRYRVYSFLHTICLAMNPPELEGYSNRLEKIQKIIEGGNIYGPEKIPKCRYIFTGGSNYTPDV